MPIRKIYLLSQTHADFGYTDHLAAVLLHHRDILDLALDVCEATANAPEGAQQRWTCEITSTTLDYLRSTTARNVDRFKALHNAGRISVGALRHHWTPLVSRSLAIQTLKDIDALWQEFGIAVHSAMQCDVNGLAWFWNDLLAERGVNFLMMQQNSHRGYWGRRVPSAWHWENRSGGSLLVLQGEHYGIGGFLRLSRKGEQDKTGLQAILDRHMESDLWPFDFSVLTVTNAANGDNVFPDLHLSHAVQDWNAREDVKMEIVTLDRLAEIIRQQSQGLPRQSGEWMDSWCDGVASTPLETATARSAERLLPGIEAMGGENDPAFVDFIEALSLYNEHTWGAHSACTSPDSIFATAQRTQKSSHAYRAFALALRLAATSSRERAAEAGSPVEGDPRFDQFSHPALGPDNQAYWVTNTGNVELAIDMPVPVDRGAGPQISIPQAFATKEFFPGMGDDGWADALQDRAPDGRHRIRSNLAPGAVAILRPTRIAKLECRVGQGWIENALARIDICPATGGLAQWTDKTSGHDILRIPTLFPSVQCLRNGFTQRDIFQAPYWERSQKPIGWNPNDLFEIDPAEVRLGLPTSDSGGGSQPVDINFASGIRISLVWHLPGGYGRPALTAMQYCADANRAFSINWDVSLPGLDHEILLDTGHGWVGAAEHVASSSLGWQSVQAGIALAENPDATLVLASPDAPLFQPNGPRYKHPHRDLGEIQGGNFWAINTHWDTNFPIKVSDAAPFRLRLCLTDRKSSYNCLRAITDCAFVVRTPFGP
ncbi:MAG: hypothetical protein OXF51_02530 [Alphaproteobacteria bacterium]|nr:hypothetical protein [Alphaproteobacteria bacterium]MCY4238180.1 hypothetical protein [Rhodospirillaceae bacterium]